jgi:hypothetical protein
MPIKEYFLMESPLGTLTLVNTDGVLSGLYMPEHKRGPRPEALGTRVRSGFEQAVSELQEYFGKNRTQFTLPLAPEGTDFQQRVWRILRSIPTERREPMRSLPTQSATLRRSALLDWPTDEIRSALWCRAIVSSEAMAA